MNTLLVVCSEKQNFIQNLSKSIQDSTDERSSSRSNEQYQVSEAQPDNDPASHDDANGAQTHPLLTRTLQVLAASQNIHLSFCPSVQVLRAYLSSFDGSSNHPQHEGGDDTTRVSSLVLINPISLHLTTSSYSAQSISETLAAAVESSWRNQCKLTVVETIDQMVGSTMDGVSNPTSDVAMNSADGNTDSVVGNENQERQTSFHGDVVEEQVAVISPSTKLFGVGGDRTLVARTVQVKDVVKRWCKMIAFESCS
ncbi:MAG: hypothetical protein Q9162_005073 [Coniocarpon cinnabarinum]